MIGRRSLITAALGALGAGASGVKAGDLVKAASGIDVAGLNGNYPSPPFSCGSDDDTASWWRASEPLRNALYEAESKIERAMRSGIPADIASKKSWSPVVKHGKAEKRLQEIRRALRALDQENTAVAMLKRLGIDI